MKPLVYVAGPYSGGDTNRNVQRALRVGDMIVAHGGLPIVPHLFHLWDLVDPKPYKHWLDLDLDFILRCDALYRLSGHSPGADKEVKVAKGLGIPVFDENLGYGKYELVEWLKGYDICESQ